ncbi:MAG: hypothetical protein ISS82_02475 [Nanoarchaeota archaeon]|nr:hypothetical protein [Nanoarchaeota archaeon]
MKIGKHVFFIALLLTLLITRLILINQDIYIDGDQAHSAYMGKLILKESYRPLFFFDQKIGGGDAILGYILAIFYFIFGISIFSAKLTMLFITCLLFVLLYIVMNKYFDKRSCFITLTLFVFPFFSFASWNITILRYMLGFVFHLVIIFLFYKIIYKRKQSKFFPIIFGFISGFGSYVFIPNLIIVIIALSLIAFVNLNYYRKKKIICFILFFLIGFSPVIYISISSNYHNFVAYNDPFGNHQYLDLNQRLDDIKNFFSDELYHSLLVRNLHLYSHESTILMLSGCLYYIIFLFLLLFLIIFNISHIINLVRKKKFNTINPEVIFLVFFIVYSMVYCFYWEKSSVYLSPLFYVILVLIGTGISRMISMKTRYSIYFKSLAVILFLILLLFSINSTSKIIEDKNPQIGTLKIIDFLNENSIHNVYTTLQFVSLIALYDEMKTTTAGVEGRPFFEKYYHLNKNEAFAIVLPTPENNRWKEPYYEKLNNALKKFLEEHQVSYKITKINGINVYYDFSEYFCLEEYGEDFLRQLTLNKSS